MVLYDCSLIVLQQTWLNYQHKRIKSLSSTADTYLYAALPYNRVCVSVHMKATIMCVKIWLQSKNHQFAFYPQQICTGSVVDESPSFHTFPQQEYTGSVINESPSFHTFPQQVHTGIVVDESERFCEKKQFPFLGTEFKTDAVYFFRKSSTNSSINFQHTHSLKEYV